MSKRKILSKKKVILLLILLCIAMIATWYTLGCNRTDFGDPEHIDIGDLENTTDVTLPLPDDDTTPADHSPLDNYYIALGNLKPKGSFVTDGSGYSSALFVKQYVKSKRVVNGNEAYKMSSSQSDFVSVAKEYYANGDTYLTRNATKVHSLDNVEWGTDASKISKESFLQMYGAVPNGLSGYIVSDDTVLSAQYLGIEGGLHKFEYNLDCEKSTTRLKLEMRTMAGTKSLPAFKKAILTVYMDDEWNVAKTATDSSYDVDMLGGVTCNEKLVDVFSAIGEGTPVPNAEYYRSFIDADVSDDDVSAFNPDATYYLTNGFTDYMSGTPLNALLTLTGNDLSVTGKLRVDLDINNLANLKLKGLLNLDYGDISVRDLFVGYENDTVYLAYGDLKLKCEISEATETVGALLSTLGVTLPDLSGINFDVDSLLTGATLERSNGMAYVTLPFAFGDVSASVKLNFVDDDNVGFAGIIATLGDMRVDVLPFDGIDYTYNYGEFVNALSLLDVIDENGNLCVSVGVGKLNALVNIDLKTMTVDFDLGEFTAKYANDAIFLKYKDIEARVAISDLPAVINKFSALFGDLPDAAQMIFGLLGNIDPDTAIADVINGITAVERDGVLTFSTQLGNVTVKIELNVTPSGYVLGAIKLSIGDNVFTVTPASYADMNVISDVTSYCDLLPLLDIIDSDYELNATVVVGEISADICFNLRDMTLLAKANILGKDLYARYENDKIYLSYLGLEAYVSVNEIGDVVKFLSPLFGTELDIEAMLGSMNFDVEELIGSISTSKTADGLILTIPVEGVNIEVTLSTLGGQYTLNNIAVSVSGTDITVAPSARADYSAISNVSTYCDLLPLLNVINSDYELNATVVVGEISADICFNLRDMTLLAKANILGKDLYARYENDKIYLSYLGLEAYVSVNEIGDVVKFLSPLFGTELNIEAMLGSMNFDVEELIGSISTSKTADGLVLTIPVEGVDIEVTLSTANGQYTLNNIAVSVSGTNITIAPSAKADYSAISDVTSYCDLLPLLDIINSDYELNATVVVGEISADICFNLRDMTLLAKANILGKDLYARYENDKIYLSYLGLEAYVSVNEIGDVVKFLSPLFGTELDIEAMLGSMNFDVEELIGSISTSKTADGLILTIPVEGVNIEVTLSTANGQYTLNNIAVSVSGTDITVAPSARADYSAISNVSTYCDLLPLLDIIDGAYNIPLKLSIGATDVAASVNLSTLRVNVKYGDIEAMLDLKTMQAYVNIGTVKLALGLNDVTAIMDKLAPTLNKLLPQDVADMLASLDTSAFESIDVESLISSMTTVKSENGVTIAIPFGDIDLTVVLSTAGGQYSLTELLIGVNGTELSITTSEPTIFASFDVTSGYVDVKQVVDKFADAINAIVVNDNLSIAVSGSISSGSTKLLTITSGEVSVQSMSSSPSVAIAMNMQEQNFDATTGAVAKERTHTLTVVYQNRFVYFNYNGFEGKFGMDKLSASKSSVQTILANIPELRDLITQYIELSDDNWLAPIEIDVLSLLGGLTFDGGVLSLNVTNLTSVMDSLPNNLSVNLTSDGSALTLGVPELAFGGMAITLDASVSGVTTEALVGKFDYTEGASCNDFSSVDTLLATLAQTTLYRSFELNGTVDLKLIGINAVKDKVHISAKIDIIDGKTYAVVSLARDAANVMGINVWNCYDGTATLYYDPIDEMLYIEDIYRTRKLSGFKYVYTTHYAYSKYTVDEFLADMMTPLLGMIHLNSTFEDMIVNAEPADTSEAYIENIFKSYSYDAGAKKFSIGIDLGPLTGGDIGATGVELTHNDNFDLTTLYVNMNVVNVIDIKLNATHVEAFGHYNGADVAVAGQVSSGNYN